MSLPQRTETPEEEFNANTYVDKSLAKLACLVCALPLKQKVMVEKALIIDRVPYEEAVKLVNNLVTATNLKDHLEQCIVGRNIHIPVGLLLNNLLTELDNSLDILGSFRLTVKTDLNADNITAFANLFNEIRRTIQTFVKLNTPAQQAHEIQRLVVAPLIVGSMQALTAELESFRAQILPTVNPSAKPMADSAIKDVLLKIGSQLKQRLDLSTVRLSEYFGVQKEDLM